MSAFTWQFWFPDDGDTEVEARPFHRDVEIPPEDIAAALAEAHWSDHDYPSEMRIALIDPAGRRCTVAVHIASEPVFRAVVERSS